MVPRRNLSKSQVRRWGNMQTDHNVPNDIKSFEYEEFFAKYYAKNIENSLFDYIDKISIKNYAKNILQSI